MLYAHQGKYFNDFFLFFFPSALQSGPPPPVTPAAPTAQANIPLDTPPSPQETMGPVYPAPGDRGSGGGGLFGWIGSGLVNKVVEKTKVSGIVWENKRLCQVKETSNILAFILWYLSLYDTYYIYQRTPHWTLLLSYNLEIFLFYLSKSLYKWKA